MFEELYNAATQHNADICFSGSNAWLMVQKETGM